MEKLSQKEFLIAGIVSTILYILAMEYLVEVPVLGFFLAWVGWLVPVAFFYGVWEKGKEIQLKEENTETKVKDLGEIFPKIKHKILLVDTNPFLLDMYSIKLTENGAEVFGFSDYSGDIIKRILDINPDLICTDILFPKGPNGFEAIKIIKADERTRNIPVVFLSNMSENKHIEEARQLGAIDYIVKADNKPLEVVHKLFNNIC